jgi:hypothetical protein
MSRIVSNIFFISALLFLAPTWSTLCAKEKGPTSNTPTPPPTEDRAGGNNEGQDNSSLDDQGPNTPNVNPDEESAEDKDFLNSADSTDFQEVPIDE